MTRPVRMEEFAEIVPPVRPPEGGPRDPVRASCPVVPLGHHDGFYVLLSYTGELRRLRAHELESRAALDDLLGKGIAWAYEHFPRYDREGKVSGIAVGDCGAWLMRACHDEGIWDPAIEIRQPGVWPGDDDAPIVHAGDAVLIEGEWRVAGFRHRDALYPAAPRLVRPVPAVGAEVAQGLLDDLALWRWQDEGAPVLVLGWVGVAMLGAAASWRPNLFITGSTGSGKTALCRWLEAVLPIRFVTTDTSRAGLYQNLHAQPRPVLIDEAEGEEGAGRLLALLRSAGGTLGALVNRGAADAPRGRTMRLICSVCMLAIGQPAMQPQDEGRFTVLELLPPQAEDRSAEMRAAIAHARRVGPGLFGRVLAGFPRWQRTLAVLREALVGFGCRPREADQLGALLAGYWILVDDAVPSPAAVRDMLRLVAPFIRTAAAVQADDGPRRCLAHLVSAQVITGDNRRRTVGELISLALEDDPALAEDRRAARADLARYGIGFRADDAVLWLANRHAGLAWLFRDTPWAEDRWRGELLRLSGAVRSEGTVRIGPRAVHPTRAIGLPVAAVFGEGNDDGSTA